MKHGKTRKQLNEFEFFYVKFFKSYDRKFGYNKKNGGNHSSFSEETKINMRIKNGKTHEEFIKEAKKIHKNKYLYDKVKYINYHTKVEIFCRNCNIYFWQEPSHHLMGKGCAECRNKGNRKRFADTKKQFIQKARKIHGNTFDYSEFEYVNQASKSRIRCKKCNHISFIRAQHHLKTKTNGCKLCNLN